MLEARAIRPDGLSHVAAWLVDIETMERCRMSIDWDGAATQLFACIAADDDLEDTTWCVQNARGEIREIMAGCLEAVILGEIVLDRVRKAPASVAELLARAIAAPTTTDLSHLRAALFARATLDDFELLARLHVELPEDPDFRPVSELLADLQAHLARGAA